MDSSDEASHSANAVILIVLCGLVGSGKSGFATALQREFPDIRRCNQDELGRRQDVEREVNAALSQGLSVCVDRVNFDQSQRRTWINIARQYPRVEIWCLKMDTPYNDCYARVLERKDHPTLKTPEQAVRALRMFRSQYVPFNVSEGFNRVYRIVPHKSPEYTREDLANILTAARESPYFPSPDSLPPVKASNNPQGRGGWGRGSSSTREYRGQGAPKSHGWRSHRPLSPESPSPRGTPSHQDVENWRTRERTAMNTPWSRGRGRGGYWRRNEAINNSNNEQNNGNQVVYSQDVYR